MANITRKIVAVNHSPRTARNGAIPVRAAAKEAEARGQQMVCGIGE